MELLKSILITIASVLSLAIMGSAFVFILQTFHARRVRALLGLTHTGTLEVVVSSLESQQVIDSDGVAHALKSGIVDFREYDHAARWIARAKDALMPAWLSASQLNRLNLPGLRLGATKFVIRPSSLTDVESNHETQILIGSYVFNKHVARIHKQRSLTRISYADEDKNPLFLREAGPRLRHLLLPNEVEPSILGRERVRLADNRGQGMHGSQESEIEYFDLAMIQRVTRRDDVKPKTVFVVAGLGSGGTQAALDYFWRHSRDLMSTISAQRRALESSSEEFAEDFVFVFGWWTSDFADCPSLEPKDIVYQTNKPPRLNTDRGIHRAALLSSLNPPIPSKQTISEGAPKRPARPLVVLDYDGVIAELVDDPRRARPNDLVEDAIEWIVNESDIDLAVVSSRPIDFLSDILSQPDYLLIGNKGQHYRYLDQDAFIGDADVIQEKIRHGVNRVRSHLEETGIDQSLVEDKGLSFALHYRRDPQLEPELRAVATRVAQEFGLIVTHGKQVFELEAGEGQNKGDAIRRLSTLGYDWICYVGDDTGDIPAFDAIGDLPEGTIGKRVASVGPKSPLRLLRSADLLVYRPPAVGRLLEDLVEARRTSVATAPLYQGELDRLCGSSAS